MEGRRDWTGIGTDLQHQFSIATAGGDTRGSQAVPSCHPSGPEDQTVNKDYSSVNELTRGAFYRCEGINLRRQQREGKEVNIPYFCNFILLLSQEKDTAPSKRPSEVQRCCQGCVLQHENFPRDLNVSGHASMVPSHLPLPRGRGRGRGLTPGEGPVIPFVVILGFFSCHFSLIQNLSEIH